MTECEEWDSRLLSYIRDKELCLLERWDALMDYTEYSRPDSQTSHSNSYMEAELQKFIDLNKEK